jgi:hypothetical protein
MPSNIDDIDLKVLNYYQSPVTLQSFFSFLLLLLFALGSVGMQIPALIVTPAEAAEEDQTSEQREEDPIRNSATRKHRARREKAKRHDIKLPVFAGAVWNAAGAKARPRSFSHLKSSVSRLHLLQVCRI